MAAGYSESEAKDKIGAVVLTEIYDILKEGQAFDEKKYRNSLEEMLRQSIDYEDDHHIRTEWDEWDDLAQKGYWKCLTGRTKTTAVSGAASASPFSGKARRRVTWGVSCNMDNSFLFLRGRELADYVGKEDESKWYQQQLSAFESSLKKWEMDEEDFFDEFTAPKQIPVKKGKKYIQMIPAHAEAGKSIRNAAGDSSCCGEIHVC